MDIIVWLPLAVALVSGSGGGLLGAFLQGRRDKEALVTSSKEALRKQLDDAVGKALAWYPGEFERLVKAYDAMAARNDELLAKYNLQVEEIRVAYAALAETQALLSETKAQLAVAKAEVDRKEAVIVKLQAQIEQLQAQVEALQRRLAECGDSGKVAHN